MFPIISGLAIIDLTEAADWYDDRSYGRGLDFLDHVDRTLEFIKINPLQYQRIGRSLRKAKIDGYPYSIYYYILKDRITVIGCLHNARDINSILEERT